jgi:hypothetical protein
MMQLLLPNQLALNVLDAGLIICEELLEHVVLTRPPIG